jgi:hypothetical protein
MGTSQISVSDLRFLRSVSVVHNLSSSLSEGDAREPSSSSSSDLFNDWPKANDMAANAYVALIAEGLSSYPRPKPRTVDENLVLRAPSPDNLIHKRSCLEHPISKGLKALVCPARDPKRQRNPLLKLPPRRPYCNFDQSKWEIMYLHFVEEGLIDPPGCASKKNV